MESEPSLSSYASSENDSIEFRKEKDVLITEEEDPYSLSGQSISLFGLAIAFVMLGIPFLAVLRERPSQEKSLLPSTVLDQNGFKSSSSVSISRFGKPSS